MMYKALRGISVMFFMLFILRAQTLGQNYTYTQSFETTNPFQFWTSNATYTINYFGPSSDRYVDGTKSLKMDITINGSGTKECYYYWTLPIKINLQGQMDFSTSLWMDSETAKYVKLGYNYGFPPTGLTRTPGAVSVTQYNTWFKQSARLSDDIVYHADYFAQNKIYGSTYDDFGRELNFFQLIIKAVGSKRLVFYIDKLELRGTVMNQSTYAANCDSWWAAFQQELSVIKSNKHLEYNNLPLIPSTTGVTLTAKGQEYLNNLNKAKTDMASLFSTIDGSIYFAPSVMTQLNELLSTYKSLVELLKIEINNSTSKLAVFGLDPTEYNRLTGSNIPGNITPNPILKAKVCPGEYEPLSLFLQARTQVNNIKVQWTQLTGPGGSIPQANIDVSIAKVWYQNGYAITGRDGKWLTQELLVKNDDLIKVDETAQSNSLLVQKSDGTKYYLNISNPTASVPSTVKIYDSNVLLPFSLPAYRNKQLWITVKTPDNLSAGIYKGSITLSADVIGTITTIPIEIEVLPFKLAPSKIDYAIYYHGYVNDYTWSDDPFTSFGKNRTQYTVEMQDMKDHGVLYPVMNQSLNSLGIDLTLRNQVGMPKDKLFSQTVGTGKSTSLTALNSLKSTINSWKTKMTQYGYSGLYCYGIDEAVGDELLAERTAWQAVHDAGAKVFASGYYTHYDAVGDLLDVAVIQNLPRKEQADLYHSRGHEIYSYRNPMVGVEDPEVNRRNYGFVLWKENYDGMMNYAYQRNYKDIWNDFDIETNQPHPYRDHVYTYPVTNGIIRTIEWEGLREGVDDIRYISTLATKIDSLKKLGRDVTELEQFVNSIDPNADLNKNRQAIIDKILWIQTNGGITDNVAPTLTGANASAQTTVKVNFSEKVNSSEALQASNYAVNGITINSVQLNAEQTEAILNTSPLVEDQTNTIVVKNVKDVAGNLISSSGNSSQFTFGGNKIVLKAENGALSNGATKKTYAGSLSTNVVYCTSTSSTIKFNINVTVAGEWYAWGRFYFGGSSSTQNAFSIKADNIVLRTFGNNEDYFNRWHWGGDGRYTKGPLLKEPLGSLSVGPHTITIYGKEPGENVMLDLVVLTNNPDYVPTDSVVKLLKTNDDLITKQLPTQFELSQNYPNPFNPSTKIKYALPKDAFVSLKVYDILGKEVVSLVNESQEAGFYETEFNAQNLSTGIYIYRIQAGDFVQVKKMLMVK